MDNEKIISKENFAKIRNNLRETNKRVVLCHGVYDLLHYGHIEHLQEAKEQGNILVVSITAANFVNKGPGRPYFNDKQRMAFLASLEIVDYVLLSEAVTVHDIVKYVQPDIYVKGQEYAKSSNDITGNIGSEQEVVEHYGGTIYFTQGKVFSSTKLLNNFFAALPDDVAQVAHGLKDKYGVDLIARIRQHIASFADLKVLVVGDIIVDEYVFCQVQGVTSKDGILSTRYESEERYAGGSLAIARHLANFSDNVTLCSMMGAEAGLDEYIMEALPNVKLAILPDEKFVTPIKRRFLKKHPQRQEYDKLFSINMLLNTEQMKDLDYTVFKQWLGELLPQYDLVVVCDYGHGLLDSQTIKLLETKAKYLAVNCQTNSSNYGTNLINKYSRADAFVVDERELRLAFGQSLTAKEILLKQLYQRLNATIGWVTIGAAGAIGQETEQILLPAVTLHVKDTVGAGDAFYALAALCAAKKLPLDIATLISNTAGAIKTNVVGNAKAVEKVELVKFLHTLLNV